LVSDRAIAHAAQTVLPLRFPHLVRVNQRSSIGYSDNAECIAE